MVKKDGTYYLKEAEKNSLPTETDPIAANGAPVKEGDTYYVADTGEVGVFLDGEWVHPEDTEETQEGE
ncbi:MAG: hypothetical protein J6Z02_02515 [Lachnospiraceae bacterium]|nr:hypothetical protein [Lachnospiraceae bacterium]